MKFSLAKSLIMGFAALSINTAIAIPSSSPMYSQQFVIPTSRIGNYMLLPNFAVKCDTCKTFTSPIPNGRMIEFSLPYAGTEKGTLSSGFWHQENSTICHFYFSLPFTINKEAGFQMTAGVYPSSYDTTNNPACLSVLPPSMSVFNNGNDTITLQMKV